MRRGLLVSGGVVVTLVAVLAGVVADAFLGNTAIEDGRTFAEGRITTVLDLYVACFIVETSTGPLLIDACMNPGTVARALQEMGHEPSDVSHVFLTHGHTDHVGAIPSLPNAAVHALGPELPRLDGRVAHRGPVLALLGARDSGVRAVPVDDGDQIVVGDTTVEILSLTGHTAGSAAFRVHDVLFVGDSAAWRGDHLAPAPWVFSDDLAENRQSLADLRTTLQQRPVAWIAPAHTGPVAWSTLEPDGWPR